MEWLGLHHQLPLGAAEVSVCHRERDSHMQRGTKGKVFPNVAKQAAAEGALLEEGRGRLLV